jgi:sec-independent protein translocase protein TatC
VIFAQFVVIPQAVHYLLWFTDWLGFEPDLRLTEWLNFAILVPVIFGFAFQTPLVMLMLERVGLVTIEGYKKVRRFAIFALVVVAAMLAPGDLTTMLIMTGCMLLFYEAGILLCRLMPRRQWSDFDVPDADDRFEV